MSTPAPPITIRHESPSDHPDIRAVNLAAFPSADEADLIDRLRVNADPVVSLVAQLDGCIIAHLMLSPVTIDASDHPLILGLAPMCVDPAHQRKGIGSALIQRAIDEARRLGAIAMVVLGDPTYYAQAGFRCAAEFGLHCEYDAPEGCFRALELLDGALSDVRGLVRYHPEFAELG
jgi:putative acetyltransferase